MTVNAKTAVPSAATNGKNGHSLISDAKSRQLYGLALRLQLLANDAAGRGWASMRGRAAAVAGVAADLREGDTIFAGYSGPLWGLLRGELHVSVTAPGGSPKEDEFADRLSAAAGDRLRKNGRVTIMLFPAEAMGSVLAEARAMATAARLPVIFVEEGSAGPGAEKAQRGRRANGAAPAHAMPAIPVDAHDVIAMYRVAHESIARAREGTGPTRIICLEARAAAGHTADAVADLEGWLRARGLPAQEWRREIIASRNTA